MPSILKTGTWESHIVQLVKKYSKKKKFVLLDVGANIGLISKQILNSKIKIYKTFCFEPDKEKMKLTTFLEFKNNLSKILEAINLGLKNFAKPLNFFNFGGNNQNTSPKKWVRNDKNDNIKV